MAQQAAPVARPTTRKRKITTGTTTGTQTGAQTEAKNGAKDRTKTTTRAPAARTSVLLEPLPSILPRAQAEPKPTKPAPTEQDIRERAYQIYLERGRQPGHDVDDWFQAERELRGRAA